jgi:hypothetical protein
MSWGEDELFSFGSGAHDVTASYNLVSEALDEGRHPKGGHSAGLLVAFRSTCVSVHHNLLAHNDFRSPLLTDVGRVDYVNNLAYNFGVIAGQLLPDLHASEVNLRGNAWIPGTDSSEYVPAMILHGDHPVHYVTEPYHLLSQAGSASRVWNHDNDMQGRPILGAGYAAEPIDPRQEASQRFPAPEVTPWPAVELEQRLAPVVGATAPARDGVDARVLADLAARTGRIIDDPAEVGGVWVPAPAPARADGDRDGIPDDQEIARGLDPRDAADGVGDPDGDGYTNLEDWLFSLLAPGG